MKKYLLDTNICIFLIKEQHVALKSKLREQLPGTLYISSVTIAELHYGAFKSKQINKNLDALSRFIRPFELAAFDHNAAIAYGKVRADLERRGCPIGALDTLLAAQALSMSAIMVTNNVREFERVHNLTVEDWTR